MAREEICNAFIRQYKWIIYVTMSDQLAVLVQISDWLAMRHALWRKINFYVYACLLAHV
jgi:hypothetical protein